MRKIICVAMAFVLIVLSACAKSAPAPVNQTQTEAPAEPAETQESPELSASNAPIKIGIITGQASREGGDEFRAAENIKAMYGDMIEIETFTDNFAQDAEALAAKALALAERGVEAIVIVQAVQGTADAIDKVRETYPDMLFIAGASAEEPEVIASKADIVMNIDEVGLGAALIEQAKKMGAKTFIHYTFPRHMSYEALSDRRDLMKEECEKNGMQFVDTSVPDPTGEDGVSGAQKFLIDDIPRMVERYGKDTAFFSTECDVQEALIKIVLQEGALYPQQCHPSPYHSYPGALSITIPDDKMGDVQYVLEQIQNRITEKGGNSRFSTWPIPSYMLFVEAGVEYAFAYLEGNITDRNDSGALAEIYAGIIGNGKKAMLTNYKTSTGEFLDNYYLVSTDFINF